jgi:hypothetical protein
MTVERHGRHVQVAEDGEVVAFADVEPLEDRTVVRAALHARAGHLPIGTRTRLVDAVLEVPETRRGTRLEATLPIGDAESLERLRERCEEVHTRSAGASCLLDAVLPSSVRRRPRAGGRSGRGERAGKRRRTRAPGNPAGNRDMAILAPPTPSATGSA